MLPISRPNPNFTRGNAVPGINSVRHIQPYQGSTDVQDLLDLYVGNTHYRKINRYMRSPNHETGMGQILDEMVTRDGKRPPSYNEAFSQAYNSLDSIAYPVKSTNAETINQILAQEEPLEFLNKLYKSPNLFDATEDYLYYQKTPRNPDVPHYYYNSQDHRRALIELREGNLAELAKQKASQLSSWQPLRQEAEQVVASIPHVQKAIQRQPHYQSMIDESAGNKEAAQAYLAMQQDADLWDDSYHYNQYKKFNDLVFSLGLNATLKTKDDLIDFAKKLSDGSITHGASAVAANPLTRGLHFKSPEEFRAFRGQHLPGKVVEYPAFTSTTTSKNIMDGFSQDRGWEHPVLMKIEPNTGGSYNAFDVNNPAEAEYLYPPNSRFEVLEAKTIPGATKTAISYEATDDDPFGFNSSAKETTYQMPEGLELTVRETSAPTRTQARTSSILQNLKAKRLLDEHLNRIVPF